ncbi:hypothetical protein F4801DRAFT_575053 [Xylaria longipes]|nr:hypothetical protein F4801DRAFT_575053 [Xylaria longipes]RYC63369.1 hypothetical protein CHU98_g2871 [Xylaria longipes]
MGPSTKIWLVTLNQGHSMVETTFSGIWTETLMAAASNTNEYDQYYTVFQCNDEPDRFAMILGNSSIDTSLEDQMTGDKPLSRLMEFITIRELFHLDIDAHELPLDLDKIAILFSESQPKDSDSFPGKGEWGVSTSWFGAKHDASKPEKKTWIHVASSENADQLSQAGDIKNFSKILESHIASQTAE